MNDARCNFPSPVPSSSFASALRCLGLLACAALLPAEARAQGPVVTLDQAPPPMKYVPAEERTQIQQARDLKGRTRLCLELADARLERAAQHTAAGHHDRAATEIGIYQALIADLMQHLKESSEIKNGKVSNKTRDLYKRVELALRSHGPRIESIRRVTPSDDAVHVRAAYDYTRQARAEALNAFYGDTVLRDNTKPKKEDSLGKEPGKASPPNP
ncbi:MAG: hypothetical protein ACRD68_17030 [Pyrinomonadaceae bacterium]